MSWVSKQLKSAKKVVKKVAKGAGKVWEAVDDVALPAIGFALGGPAGAALGAAGARAIGDGKFNAKATIGAGIRGGAMGAIGSAAGLTGGKGIDALVNSGKTMLSNPGAAAMNVVRSKVPGMGAQKALPTMSGVQQAILNDPLAPVAKQATGSVVNNIAQMGPQVSRQLSWGGAGDMLKNVGNFALNNKDLLLGGLAGYEGYQNDKKADAMRKRQEQLAMGNWNQTAPLRTMGQNMMMDQSLEDLSGIARNRYNPFSR